MAYAPIKRDKTTFISFNEYDDVISIITHNTSLKKRLIKYSMMYPDLCKLIFDDGEGSVEFEIQKDRLSFRLLNPCSETRKEKARSLINNINHKEGDNM